MKVLNLQASSLRNVVGEDNLLSTCQVCISLFSPFFYLLFTFNLHPSFLGVNSYYAPQAHCATLIGFCNMCPVFRSWGGGGGVQSQGSLSLSSLLNCWLTRSIFGSFLTIQPRKWSFLKKVNNDPFYCFHVRFFEKDIVFLTINLFINISYFLSLESKLFYENNPSCD